MNLFFSYFVMRAIDKKQKKTKSFSFSSVGHCHIILKGSVYFLENSTMNTENTNIIRSEKWESSEVTSVNFGPT